MKSPFALCGIPDAAKEYEQSRTSFFMKPIYSDLFFPYWHLLYILKGAKAGYFSSIT
jgi:hypothetical protein